MDCFCKKPKAVKLIVEQLIITESRNTMMQAWPDLPRGRVDSIGGVRDVGDPASNQTRMKPVTVAPPLYWLSTKHNLIDLAKKVFPASESKNTSKKG